MSTIARHHNEWLSLIEISGPFLSLPVLMRTFPQGLDALDRDGLAELRLAYEEWLDDQNSLRPSPAIHSVWVRYVLGDPASLCCRTGRNPAPRPGDRFQ